MQALQVLRRAVVASAAVWFVAPVVAQDNPFPGFDPGGDAPDVPMIDPEPQPTPSDIPAPIGDQPVPEVDLTRDVVPVPTTPRPRTVIPREQSPIVEIPPPVVGLFEPPPGLSRSVEEILRLSGHNHYGRYSGMLFPYDRGNCTDIAADCYAHRMYQDAEAFAEHGLRLGEDDTLLKLKGASELAQGKTQETLETIETMYPDGYRGSRLPRAGLINDPVGIRFLRAVRAVGQNPALGSQILTMP